MPETTVIACRRGTSAQPCSITWEPGGYVVRFPYDPPFIERLKTILPRAAREYSKPRKVWLVAPEAIELAASLLAQHFNQQIDVPPQGNDVDEVAGDIRLEYLGAAKERDGGPASSFGFANGSWSVVIPQTVLEAWFNKSLSPDKSTFFATLLVPETADLATIKSAYRRLARQWHPDVCREENAADRFREIQEAYESLSDEQRRSRYLAGLFYERQDKQPNNNWRGPSRFNTYSPPLRCGLLNVTGQMKLGRLVVSKINEWRDIVNDAGQVMVSTWQAGNDTFQVQWRDQ